MDETQWRHVKTGGIYAIESTALLESDATPMVVYRNVATGERWVRPAREFYDGRFLKVKPQLPTGTARRPEDDEAHEALDQDAP